MGESTAVQTPKERQKFHSIARRKQGEFGKFLPILEDARPSVKKALDEHFFRMRSFDIYDAALSMPELSGRFFSTVKTPEDLNMAKRQEMLSAIISLVDEGKMALGGLMEAKLIKPEAPIGYWNHKKFARFWVDEILEAKMSHANLHGRAQEVVLKMNMGERLTLFEDLVYQELKREALCSSSEKDFWESGMDGLYQIYGASIFGIASKLYPEFKINIWEVESKGVKRHFLSKKNRVDAIGWLTEQFRKKFRDYSDEEAKAYMRYMRRKASMNERQWGAFRELDPFGKKDPAGFVERDYLSHGLRKLLEQYPTPHRAKQALDDYYSKDDSESTEQPKPAHKTEPKIERKKKRKTRKKAPKRQPVPASKPAAQAIQKAPKQKPAKSEKKSAPKPQPVQKTPDSQRLPRTPRTRAKKQSGQSPYSIATQFIMQCKTELSSCRANATVIVQMNKATQISWKSERQDYKVSIRLEISLEKRSVQVMIAGRPEEFPLEKLGMRLKFIRNKFAAPQSQAQ